MAYDRPMRTALGVTVLLGALVIGCGKPKSTTEDGGIAAAPPSDNGLALLNGFEGEIDAVVKGSQPGEAPVPIEVFVKSDKVRLDVPEKLAQGASFMGPKAYVLFDAPAKKLSIVSDEQKQVLVIDLTKSGEQLKGFKGLGGTPPRGGSAPQRPTMKLVKTGKLDTVAGRSCENWDMTSDHREGTICVAHEGVSWFAIPMTGIPSEHLWMAELLDGKHFPLRFVAYAEDGATEKSRIEVTKIDKKAPAASKFEYPPSYRVIDMAQMFQGLAGLSSGLPTPMALPKAKGR
jgi:hypothetical protein